MKNVKLKICTNTKIPVQTSIKSQNALLIRIYVEFMDQNLLRAGEFDCDSV